MKRKKEKVLRDWWGKGEKDLVMGEWGAEQQHLINDRFNSASLSPNNLVWQLSLLNLTI